MAFEIGNPNQPPSEADQRAMARRRRQELSEAHARAQQRAAPAEPTAADNFRIPKFENVTSRVAEQINAPRSPPSAPVARTDALERARAEGARRRAAADAVSIERNGGIAPPAPSRLPPIPAPAPAPAPRAQPNYCARNVAAVTAARPKPAPAPEATRHESYGSVPDYVLARKAELAAKKAAEEARKAAAAEAAKLPAGMIRLSDEDRLRMLHELESRRDDTLARLRAAPLAVASDAAMRRRKALDDEISELDAAIIQFSAREVFIKA